MNLYHLSFARHALHFLLAIILCILSMNVVLADQFTSDVLPFLKKHCIDCHQGSDADAKLDLTIFRTRKDTLEYRDRWLKVKQQLQAGAMPPEDEARPKQADIKKVIDWVDNDLFNVDCSKNTDPGRVTIRRLNRAEYSNTIRDLIGIDFQVGNDFPVDDSGYGFDNIGDVLTMSPLLMEKYMAAADRIVQQTINAKLVTIGKRQRFEAERLKKNNGSHVGLRVHILTTVGKLNKVFYCKNTGEYILRVRSFGQQAGAEPVKMTVSLDGKAIKTFEVSAPQSRPGIYQIPTKITRGNHYLTVSFDNDFYDPKHRDPKRRDRNLIIDFLEIQGPIKRTRKKASTAHQKLIFTTPLNSADPPLHCAQKILRKFATRAYRRPVKNSEVTRLVKFVDLAMSKGDTFERGIQLAVQATLVSPHFLFRVEKDLHPQDPENPHQINEFELASRLSYFLWSSMPDEQLFEQARKGTLRKNLKQQVQRMLKDKKSRSLVSDFAGQWLELRSLDTFKPDDKKFPTASQSLLQAMRRETELVFAEVVNKNRNVLELLNAKYTYLNEPLAKHYGIAGIKGKHFRKVALKDSRRKGILTHASILTITSNPTRTSPVKRGKWIMEQILGTPPPPAPPNVEELSEDPKVVGSASLRKRMEIHRKNPGCASCHQQMDAIGFAFENFDAIGRYRTHDGKFLIDPSGKLPSGKNFKSPSDLIKILHDEKKLFIRCLSEKLLTFALGRGLEYYDKCAIDKIVVSSSKESYTFSPLVLAIVESRPFQYRRAKRTQSAYPMPQHPPTRKAKR